MKLTEAQRKMQEIIDSPNAVHTISGFINAPFLKLIS